MTVHDKVLENRFGQKKSRPIDLDKIFVIFDEYIEILESDSGRGGQIQEILKVKRDLNYLFTIVSETQHSLQDLDNITLGDY